MNANSFNYSKYVDETYSKFNEYFTNNKVLKYKGKEYPIIINTQDVDFDGKPRIFWHICSLGIENGVYYDKIKQRLKFDIFPCTNHDSFNCCKFKCDPNNQEIMLKDFRVPCIYRMSKIDNLKKTIDLFNHGDNEVKWWIRKETSNSTKKTKKMLKLRYTKDLEDYVIMFEFRYTDASKNEISRFQFVTAFHMFDNNTKERFDKEYEEFQKNN